MHNFSNALAYVNEIFYKPNHLNLNEVRDEPQNSAYWFFSVRF